MEQIIDKEKVISDYEKENLRKMKAHYEHKNVEA